jgi:hypothetical protein
MKILPKSGVFFLAAIVGIAALLRFYQLGSIPNGLTWDEAAIGYNGYAVITTRRDEWLERLPVSFRSFGDYKAPLAIYSNGLFTYFLGLEPWVVRLPFALSGVLAVAVLYFLIDALLKLSQKTIQPALPVAFEKLLPVSAALILATSPWHIHFTRTGFESGIGLTLVLLSLFGAARAVLSARREQFRQSALWFFCSGFFAVLSLYAYHSTKVVTPLLYLTFLAIFLPKIKRAYFSAVAGLLVAAPLIIPLVRDAVFGHGLERAGVTVFSSLPFFEALAQVSLNFWVHLQPSFLLFGETDTLRHGMGAWGVLLPTTFAFGLMGLIATLVLQFAKTAFINICRLNTLISLRTLGLFGLLWFLIGLLPAAIGDVTPHPNRALLALPGWIIMAVVGLGWVFALVRGVNGALGAKLFQQALPLLLALHVFFAGMATSYYYTLFHQNSADAFNAGYLEMMDIVIDYNLGLNDKPKVDQIIMTSKYGQPYIYVLFARGISPIEYQGGLIGQRYVFVDSISEGDLQKANTLLVAQPDDEVPDNSVVSSITDQNEEPRFTVSLLE